MMQHLGSVFQFTPLREGRRQSPPAQSSPSYFNSRPSARGDPQNAVKGNLVDISIHAPPRGATPHADPAGFVFLDFNSRPSARGDARNAHPYTLYQHFNSRPSARGDEPQDANSDRWQMISIHAPPRGATGETRLQAHIRKNFNSRPSARGDASGARIVHNKKNFNSRPSARGD